MADAMIDSDNLVDGYTEEIKLLFNYHGSQYEIGETESHEDANENEYASDTKTGIWLDPDMFEYGNQQMYLFAYSKRRHKGAARKSYRVFH